MLSITLDHSWLESLALLGDASAGIVMFLLLRDLSRVRLQRQWDAFVQLIQKRDRWVSEFERSGQKGRRAWRSLMAVCREALDYFDETGSDSQVIRLLRNEPELHQYLAIVMEMDGLLDQVQKKRSEETRLLLNMSFSKSELEVCRRLFHFVEEAR